MPDLEDRYFSILIADKIDDSITSLSHSVSITVSSELFRTLGPRVRR
jgi:hypothetical protein